MLEIRDEQNQRFLERAAARIFPAIKQQFVDAHGSAIEALDPAELDRRIHNGIARAFDYGVTQIAGVAAFVGLMFEIAPNFDEQPGIAKALNMRGLDANTRVYELALHTCDEDWQHAVLNYHPGAWDRRTRVPV